MRSELGLRSPEERIGAAAHDFAQGLAAPEIVLTRASRVEGAETVPSRWLLRLDTVLRSAGLENRLRDGDIFLSWQTLLDRPAERIALPPPAPCPPVEARPRELSATRIETWMRDPYSIYARYVLRLRKLEELDAEPGAAERGQAIHAALDRFGRTHPGRLPEDAEQRLIAIVREEFGATLSLPGVWAFWCPRFERIVRWFVEAQRERERLLAESITERGGRLVFDGPAGPFALTAIADRLDRLAAGGVAILDYKTGRVPRAEDVELGFAPQLPLEAAIARAGGFGLAAGEVTELAYWRLTGNDPPGEVKRIAEGAGEVRALAEAAIAGLKELVARFDDPATPYRATPRPEWAPYFNDYAHLARLKEWAAAREVAP
jgi:ATP-dependent helicase/nuclease subunit B